MIASSIKSLRRRILCIDEAEVLFEKRGFNSADAAKTDHLQTIGSHFLRGYHLALDRHDQSLADSLNAFVPEYRGFAFEGAAMALGLLDALSFRGKHRLREFLNQSGAAHRYVGHVGYGWALARLPWSRRHPGRFLSQFDPLLRWLVLDGFGFHEGYFHWRRWLPPRGGRPKLPGYAARAFDQGLGRSLWFVAGSDPHRTVDLISQFEPDRQADLWSGIGLACAYAGLPSAEELGFLRDEAGEHVLHMGQGVTFGAEARQLAGISMPHTNLACEVVCGMSAAEAAQVTHAALKELPPDTPEYPVYEAWRSSVRTVLEESIAACP